MEQLTFKSGDYDRHMEMVNSTKELLNESLVLRSVKENVDDQLSAITESRGDHDFFLVFMLALPLLALVVLSIYSFGFSWRIIAGLGLLGYCIVYYIITKDSDVDVALPSSGMHSDNPRPLKFLDMKVDYLISHNELKKTRQLLIRAFYFIFFPFLCYFLYETLIGYTPFQNILLGLIVAILMSAIAWYLFFRDDFQSLKYGSLQLEEYKKLIQQHYNSLLDEEE